MAVISEEAIKVTGKKIQKISADPAETAKAAHLIYINDNTPGIVRVKKDDKFEYLYQGKKLSNEDDLQRIKKLAIPPAWEDVWISRSANSHLQVTGKDIRNRKQYKYHPLWNKLRNHTKFYHMYEFGKALPDIRKRLEKDISLKGMPCNKVLAIAVSLMEHIHIRIGSQFYEKVYGSFGLTTLKNKHVSINGNKLHFCFKGKKGVMHNIDLKNKKLASLIQKCRDIPGKELFQYFDEDGNKQEIDSGMVNNYIREISNGDFTAKDFRTWAGSLHAFLTLKEMADCETETEKKKNTLAAINSTAKYLGNTPNVCKKYYISPAIISLYENDKLNKFSLSPEVQGEIDKQGLSDEEKILMCILEENKSVII
jgi:DNA topoisomerase-1